jgi:DNA-binding transcriptional MocR family regulator
MEKGSSLEGLVRYLRDLAAGSSPGERLPSTRALVERHRASPVTVTRAIARLVADGVLVTETGRGTFVAPDRARRAPEVGWQTVALGESRVDGRDVGELLRQPPDGAVVLSTGYPSADLQPNAALAAAGSRAARRPGAWARPPTAGIPELRELLARGIGADPSDLLVVPGGQAGLSTALRALCPPGAPVLVEVPTYLGLLAAARGAGLRPVPVPTDSGGLRADLLPAAFAASGARLLYLQSTYANPSGSVLAHDRRQAVLDAARDAGSFVLEDDFARYLPLEGKAPPPLLHADTEGRVVHLSSLTKATAPSLRIGALVARGPAAARLAAVRVVDDFFVARPLQETAVELLGAPGWPRHLRALRAALRARRDALASAIRTHLQPRGVELPLLPAGGLHLWLSLPAGCDDVELANSARERGLIVGAGRPYFVSEPPSPHLRLSYAGIGEDRFDDALRRLGELLDRAH